MPFVKVWRTEVDCGTAVADVTEGLQKLTRPQLFCLQIRKCHQLSQQSHKVCNGYKHAIMYYRENHGTFVSNAPLMHMHVRKNTLLMHKHTYALAILNKVTCIVQSGFHNNKG